MTLPLRQEERRGLLRRWDIQIVWWTKWIGIGRGKPYPYAPGKAYHGSVYKWRFRLGFVELRKWG